MKSLFFACAALLVVSFTCSARAGVLDTNGWAAWSPRDEIAPEFTIEAKGGRELRPALKLVSRSNAEFGAWKKRFDNIVGGQTYRIVASYRAERVQHERRSVITRLQWLDAKGQGARPPEYGLDVASEASWKMVEIVTPAPTNAIAAEIQLGLGFSERGEVLWDRVEIAAEPSPVDRVVRAMTVYLRPRGMKSGAEALEQFCRLAEDRAAEKPDIICLPEGVTVVGTGKKYAEVAEAVPGPGTERLGRLARGLNSYVVAGIYERAGKLIFNTAVLIDRQGKVAGSYRKTHLPREEWEAGITPGDSYPVFDTDLGKIGIMICWDLQFPETCRAMAAQGADLVLLPIWGGSDVLAQARAIENHVFLVSATYDMRSFILDPAGKILAEATKEKPVVSAELHFDRKIFQPWLGDMKARTWKERRADIPVP